MPKMNDATGAQKRVIGTRRIVQSVETHCPLYDGGDKTLGQQIDDYVVNFYRAPGYQGELLTELSYQFEPDQARAMRDAILGNGA